jgi:tetratricopeptide (TPR) repeat protein
MVRNLLLLTSLLFASGAIASTVADWRALLDQGKTDEARTICSEAIKSSDKLSVIRGYNCLANLALKGQDVVMIEKSEMGGGSIHPGYNAEGAKRALDYLNKSIDYAPDVLTTFQSRMYLMVSSGQYDAAADMLKDSLKRYKGPDAFDAWLAYTDYFYQAGQYTAGINYLKVLDERYPNNQKVLSDIGAFYAMQEDDANALPYMKRSVELAPNDALNNWNLGREYDYSGDNKNADFYYQKSLRLDAAHSGDPLPKDSVCIYRQFVYEKLQDKKRACAMQANGCDDQKFSCTN